MLRMELAPQNEERVCHKHLQCLAQCLELNIVTIPVLRQRFEQLYINRKNMDTFRSDNEDWFVDREPITPHRVASLGNAKYMPVAILSTPSNEERKATPFMQSQLEQWAAAGVLEDVDSMGWLVDTLKDKNFLFLFHEARMHAHHFRFTEALDTNHILSNMVFGAIQQPARRNPMS